MSPEESLRKQAQRGPCVFTYFDRGIGMLFDDQKIPFRGGLLEILIFYLRVGWIGWMGLMDGMSKVSFNFHYTYWVYR